MPFTAYESDQAMVKRGFWAKVKKYFAHIPFIDQLVAAYFCAMDRKTPLKARATLLAALAYFIMPFDVVPDFMLGLGFSDDMAVLFTTLATMRYHITDEHRAKAREMVNKLKAQSSRKSP